MAYPQVSFTKLLHGLARDAGQDPTDQTPAMLALLTHVLNRAVEWIWCDYMEMFAHPATVTQDTKAITDKVLTREQVEGADWVSLWTVDPRTNREARRLLSTADGDGWHLCAAVTTAFVFWRAPLPEFVTDLVDTTRTYNPSASSPTYAVAFQNADVGYDNVFQTMDAGADTFVDPDFEVGDRVRFVTLQAAPLFTGVALATIYYVIEVGEYGGYWWFRLSTTPGGAAVTILNAGAANENSIERVNPDPAIENTLVWDKDSTGHVYMAIGVDALGSALTDADKWRQVSLPQPFEKPVVLYARYLWLLTKDLPAGATSQRQKAEAAIESQMARVLDPEGQAPIWLQFTYGN